MQAHLEDGEEIVGAKSKEDSYHAFKRMHPWQMVTAWNLVQVYAEYTYLEDAGLLPAILVELEVLEEREHADLADQWFQQEVQRKAPGMHHRILVIKGETGTGKTAWAQSKGTHSHMCSRTCMQPSFSQPIAIGRHLQALHVNSYLRRPCIYKRIRKINHLLPSRPVLFNVSSLF